METNKIVHKCCADRGFSLVELILVMAILGIVAGGAGMGINYLHFANSQKAIIKIDTELSQVRMEDMSKKEKTYLYLAAADRDGDGNSDEVFMKTTTDGAVTSDNAMTEINSGSEEWTKILASGRTLHYQVESIDGALVSDGDPGKEHRLCTDTEETGAENLIRLSFNRSSGAFEADGRNGRKWLYGKIWIMNGASNGPAIVLVTATGKHYLES